MTIKLNTHIKNVNKIFQISDIHIRLYKRKDEYEKVFENLYLDIKSKINDNDIILLTGDIVHTKTEMSPEMVELVSDLLNNLAQLSTVIVVPGNHDANLNNLDRMDAIYPIVKAIKNPNVIYIKDTGLYEFSNITFSIMGIFHKKSEYIRASDIKSQNIKIAVYHGTINGCKLDTGLILKDDKMELDFFDGFDFALCGDIHKRQILQQYNLKNKKPYVSYPGSLIQQNHGESLNNHGYLIWDLQNKSYEEVDIVNEYGYATLYLTDGEVEPITYNMPKKPRIRLKLKNTTSSAIKNCLIDIRQKYNPIEVTYAKNNDDIINTITKDKLDFSKIRDITFQNNLIKEYLTTNYQIDDDMLNEIYKLNTELNGQLPIVDIIRNIVWKPIKFEFSNMFSYGENNYIDFEKMGGVNGIFNSNASGKSALLEALTYCLFDKCSKTFRSVNVLNNRKNKFHCKLEFEIDGIRYFIEKTAKKDSKGNVPVKINFWRINDDGIEEVLNGDQRNDTNSIIRSYIGTYDDFILTAIQSQNNPANFINKTKTERKDLLLQFMDVTIFEKLYDMANSKMKEFSVLIKQFEKRDFDDELLTLNNELSGLKKQKDFWISERSKLTEEKEKIDSENLNLAKKLVEIKLPSLSLETLKKNKTILESQISDYTIEKENLIIKEDEQSQILLKASNLLSSLMELNINDRYSNYITSTNELSKLENTIENLKTIVKNKLEKSKNLLKLEYDPNCKFCMNNIFVKDAIIAQEELKQDQIKSKELIDKRKSIIETISELESVLADKEKLDKVNKLISDTETSLLQIKNKSSKVSLNLSNDRHSLEGIISEIDKYAKSKELIESNKKIEEKMSEFNSIISDYKKKILDLNNSIDKINSRIAVLVSKVQDINDEIENFMKMEQQFGIYEKYLSCMHRDAIPNNLINLSLPLIEEEINNILSQIVEFSVMLEMDDKDISVKIVYDEERLWPLELSSGMEKFITGIAIRMALIDVSSLPRPNFMAIDEGFSSLDADNMANLPMLFDYLKSHLGFVLIISHLDHIRDFVDTSIDLKKIDGFSEIKFN